MFFGVSTACFHGELETECSLELLGKNGVKNVEIFLESFYEYTPEFGEILNEVRLKYDINVNSIHVYNLHFESQLFRGTERQKSDAERLFRAALYIGRLINAKVYVMHGIANVKHINMNLNYNEITNKYLYLKNIAQEYGIKLSIENVHWCFYSKPGLITELRNRNADPYCTLDIKQAIQSNFTYKDFLPDMKSSLVNVHISDYDENKKLYLPEFGSVDFNDLFRQLKNINYNGQITLEVYRNNFKDIKDILNTLDYLQKCYSGL